MDSTSEAIRCLVLPVSDDRVLIPSAVVAEIISASGIRLLEDGPGWLLGSVAWRDSTLPVMSIEAAVGGELPPLAERAKLVVLRTLGADRALKHYALLLQGIPGQVLASSRTVQSAARDGERPFVAEEVMLEGERAFIPDLDALERALVAFAASWQRSAPGNGKASGL